MNNVTDNIKKPESDVICSEMVKKDDHDRYLTTLFSSHNQRRSLNAVYAFNTEVAKTLETTKEPLISEMKLQWWLDSIEAIYKGTIYEHPVIIELAAAINKHDLSQEKLTRIILARREELNNKNPKTLSNLVKYCGQTAGALSEITTQIITGRTDCQSSMAIGTSWGLVGIIRAISFHASLQRCMIPEELLDDANINQDDLYGGSFSPELKEAIKPIADKADGLLFDGQKSLPPKDRNAYLISSLTNSYLKRLKAVSYDIEAVDFHKGAARRLLSLTWYAMSGRL